MVDLAKIEADVAELKTVVAEIAPLARGAIELMGKVGPIVAEILTVLKALKPL